MATKNRNIIEILKVLLTQFVNNNLLALVPAIIIGRVFHCYILS